MPSPTGRSSQAPWLAPTTAPVPPPASGGLVVKTRVFDGILTGLASATIAGVLWWAIASNVDTPYWHFGAVVVGLIVGQGVLVGSRRGGLVSGILALVFTTVAVLAAVYFIDRSLMITAITDAGQSSDVSLWQGFSELKELYESWWEFDETKVMGWGLGPLVAVVIAGWPGRRPVIT